MTDSSNITPSVMVPVNDESNAPIIEEPTIENGKIVIVKPFTPKDSEEGGIDTENMSCDDDESIVVHFHYTKRNTLKGLPKLGGADTGNDPPSSIFTKTTSKTSGTATTTSSSTFRLTTCCGVVELNLVRVLSLLGMIFNIAAFIAVAIVVGMAYGIDSSSEIKLLLYRADLTKYNSQTSCIVKKAVATGDLKYVDLYYESSKNVTDTLSMIQKEIPPEQLVGVKLNFTNPQVSIIDREVIGYVAKGDLANAKKTLKSFYYNVYQYYFNVFLSSVLLTRIQKLGLDKQKYISMSTTVNLVIVLTSIVLVIPIIIFIFVMALNTEGSSTKKLRTATIMMLIDTFSNEELNSQFKEFCDNENYSTQYNFLNLVHKFHVKSTQAEELRAKQDYLKSDVEIEKCMQERLEIEKTRSDLAFFIYNDFINPTGAHVLTSNSSYQQAVKGKMDKATENNALPLPEDLFDSIEREVSESMVDFYIRFKQSIKTKRRAQRKHSSQ